MNSNKEYIAIDIAKDSLAVKSKTYSGTVPYNAQGLSKLIVEMQSMDNPIVVCEATGGYERKLMDYMGKNAIAVALVNPVRVRAFAKSKGIKTKTDPIDAALLLDFAQSKNLEPTPPLSDQQRTFQALMDRRSQLTESLAREKNRLEKCSQCVRKSIEKMIGIIEEELAGIEEQIEQLVNDNEVISKYGSTLQSVVGVGKTTAWTILAYLPEITTVGRNQLVALAGVSPFNKDSGKYSKKRRIEGGRAKVRKCLYMAAQSAAVHNQHIKKYVDDLRARGKPYKCAIVAAMRKLLIHLQVLLKKQKITLA
jgi:transposase